MLKSIKTLPILTLVFLVSFTYSDKRKYNLSIEVENLRNSKGVVQFALYNQDGSIPDEHYKNYYKIETAEINNEKAKITFFNIPEGIYAINILHDENQNKKIDKGFILPKEGIGFSNYNSIGLTNQPNFKKASFELNQDKKIKIPIIYM